VTTPNLPESKSGANLVVVKQAGRRHGLLASMSLCKYWNSALKANKNFNKANRQAGL